MDRSVRHGVEQLNVILLGTGGNELTLDRRRLESRGYHVVQASDPDAAIAMARTVQPRTIFLSVEGLGSERTSFLVALRRDDHTRHIPVIVLARGRDDALDRIGLSRVGRDAW